MNKFDLRYLDSLDYKDVFIIPKTTEITSRKNIDTSVELFDFKLDVPLISANMDTVTDGTMALAMAKAGAIGAIHRFMPIQDNVKEFLVLKEAEQKEGKKYPCLVSLGVNGDSFERFSQLYNNGARYFVVDVAHGDSSQVADLVNKLVTEYEDVYVMAGNVATYIGTLNLKEAGANAIKAGIGPGAVCTTKNITGVTVPQFTAVQTCVEAAGHQEEYFEVVPVVADGGITEIGDISKALGIGASLVMAGRLFASCVESCGPRLNGKKVYRGMACYSSDTECLTENGWKLIKDINLNEKVATLNKNDELEYNYPINKFSYSYNDDLIHLKSTPIDLCVTPNHNMYVAKRNGKNKEKFSFKEAKDCINSTFKYQKVCNWLGEKPEFFFLQENKKLYKIPYKEWLDFFGFWLAEGSCYKYNVHKNINHWCYVLTISNNDLELITKYKTYLETWGIKSKIRQRNKNYELIIYNKILFNYLKQFGKSYDKFIPKEIKNLCSEYLDILLTGIFLGDGNKSKNSIYTNSIKLRDDIYEIALKTNRTPSFSLNHKKDSIGEINNKSFKRNYDVWCVNIGDFFLKPIIKKYNYSKIKYSGQVYCLEVPNNILCVRRNGKYVWCGNSRDAMLKIRSEESLPTPEGKSIILEDEMYTVEKIIQDIKGGLQSAFSYSNAKNLTEFQKNTIFGIRKR